MQSSVAIAAFDRTARSVRPQEWRHRGEYCEPLLSSIARGVLPAPV